MKVFPIDGDAYRADVQGAWRAAAMSAIICACLLIMSGNATAVDRYTDRQLDAFQERVGKTYWVDPRQGKPPSFLNAPGPGTGSFTPTETEAFEITELAGRSENDPYYKVRFESGKIGYLRPEAFIEEFNQSILSMDPLADKKNKADEESSEEKKRVAWINAQPWSPAVKQAAIKKQPTPGLNTGEVRHVLGPPRRIRKVRGPLKAAEEQWFYPDGSVMIFSNGLLVRIDQAQK